MLENGFGATGMDQRPILRWSGGVIALFSCVGRSCAAVCCCLVAIQMFKSSSSTSPYKPGIQNHAYTLEGGVRVNPSYKDCVLPNILGKGSKCVHDLFKEAMSLGGDRPFLGTHVTPTSPYVWRTFNEVYVNVKKFGSGLRTLDSLSSEPFKCVGIYGKNRPEWFISEYACFSYKLTTVPLFDTFGEEALLYICKQTELSVVVCDTAVQALKLLNLAETIPFVKHLIIMNSDDDLTALKARAGDGIQVFTFNDILIRGEASPLETTPSEPDDLVLICYTSGTTGVPKGVMATNRMMLASLNNNILNCGRDIITEDGVYLSYLPMAHIFEQMFILLTIFNRGRIGFYSGEPRLLFDDAKQLKPTLWTAVPRILLRIYEGVQKKIGNSELKQRLFAMAVASKINRVDKFNFSKNTIWDMLFFSKVRALLGGHVQVIVCGGAPLPTHILRFTRAAFSCWVFEGYGSTETLGSLSSANASDREGGHVGAPAPGLKVILADIPSMGIVAERDNKGEICVKGPSCTSGYFKDPDNTAKLFDSEGWMRTGDVGIWTEKNSLRIVDRCKHIFKLSQGEYVAPEKIEWVYLESRFVSQVFVDGDTEQAYPVAIVVPEVETLVQHINSKVGSEIANGDSSKDKLLNGHARPQNGGDVNAPGEQAPPSVTAATVDNTTFVVHGTRMTIEELCDYEPAIKAVLDDLSALGKARGLKGFEQVKAIQLSPAPFTIENGMLTPTLKAAREIIRRQFRSAIKALYQPSATI
ncbi:long chain fatty acid coenzyme A ligase 5 [Echinococcus multilocularis]|uniref:long-chain-fatty-acid--CoA ligase n=1 Tax=Echinococcus multilocularis TaxID=6211 RepID=A0A087VXW2_ECHMU|nr:long chain fatty acid coenzyme A ligase 5 [Echinococcus multilocularis]